MRRSILGKSRSILGKKRKSRVRGTFERLDARIALAGEPIINEFMAADQNTHADEDGEFADWVEIVNHGDAPIDLAGWHLTDNPNLLNKWTFPAKTLNVDEHLVVFASNKNRAVADQQLHTNFRLDNDGEFLALVRPDESIASQYTPTYPQQILNTSYGIATEIQTVDLLQAVADAKVLVPTNATLGTSWTEETFDDAAWQDAITGVGYTTEGPVALQSGWVLRMVQNGTTPGTATGAAAIINGPGPFSLDQTRVVPSVNHGTGGKPGDQAWPNGVLNNGTSDFVAKATATVTIPAGNWTIGFGSDEGGYLRFGSLNFNATTHGENGTTTAGDNEIRYEGTRTNNWTTGQITVPAGGVTTTIEVVSFENSGADSLEILVRNTHSSNSFFGTFGTLLADGTFGWQVKSTAPLPAPPYGTLIQTNLQSQIFQQRTSAYLRVPILLSEVPVLDTLKLRMKYDDAFVAYLNGVEVARSNVAAGTPAWNSTAASDRPDGDAMTFHDFDISGAIDELIEGENVLAIHGLNANTTAADQAFLLLPELIGTDILGNSLDYMSTATPGAVNVPGFDGLGAGPAYSQTSGTFTANFSLTLSTSDVGGEIRYTLDGSTPSATSTLYTGPIPISNTTQVRARTFVPDFLPSPIVGHTFFKLDADVQNFSSDLPIVILDTFGGAIDGSTLRTSFMTIAEPGAGGRAAITDVPDTVSRTGIKFRGSSTGGDPKHQYKLETWDEANDDRNLPLVGMPSESDWVFFASYNFDRAMMRNELMYQLSNEMGVYAPRTRYVEMFLNSGGTVSQADYIGVYSIMESVAIDADRVDIDELFPADDTPPEVTGGYMFKNDRCDNGDTGFSAGGMNLCWHDPVAANLSAAQEAYLINYVNQFGNALNGPNYTNPTTGYAAYFDVDLSIDHHLLNVLSMNVDALRLSTYMYKPRGGKITFGPIWDFDRSMESTDGRDDNPLQWNGPPDSTIYFTPDGRHPWWGRLFTDPNFWQKWIDRWQELRETTLSTEHIFESIDGFAEELSEAAVRNFARWTATPPRGGSYQGEITILKNWLQSRANWIDGRFTRMPTLSRGSGTVTQGTQVTLTGPAGATIYYTLNGSDPRAPGGGIAPGALVYSGTPITINDNTRVTARAKTATQIDGSTWSGPRIGDFLTDPNPLVVTEINFHPADPTAAEFAAGFTLADDFEFIEVQNVRDRNLNLAGYKFTGGIDFTFGNLTLTPGQKAVVARNSAAFAARYGAGITVAGQYGNDDPLLDSQLDNGGEPIELTGPFDNLVQEFAYADGWYDLVDGNGFSLVVVDPNGPLANWNTKAGWRPSDFGNGSPTSGDTGIAPADESILISEILSNSNLAAGDRIELFNPTAAPIDVRYWYVTDDETNLTKYQFASSTVVPAMGYRVVSKVELGPSFALSNLGGDLILQAANSSNVMIGFRATQDFDGAAVEGTLGRYTNSVGDVDFAPQTTSTLGGGNSAPSVGPVVIHEIMYHPPEDSDPVNEDEYIELYNPSAADVPLYDVANPGNTWTMTGIGDFAFPIGATIPAGGFVLVTSINPEIFRVLYSVPAAVQIFEMPGGLSNAGETINLFRPGAPEAGGVPAILVDHIQYTDLAPWPQLADGNGSSLSRLSATAYGNEPENWLPSTAGGTPGRTNTYHDTSPPTVPTSVATTLMGPAHVDLTWTASADPQSAVLFYNIYRNNVLVGTSATASFSDTTAIAGTPLVYEISAVNLDQAESARSTPTAPLTIMAISSATAPQEHSVRVIFSEPVVEADAEDLGNYSIDGGVRIVAATLAGDGRTVVLRTTSLAPATTYTVTAGNIFGLSGNEVAPSTDASFVLSAVLEAFTVRHVDKATGQVNNLAAADALLALPPGNPGIGSEATLLAPILDYKDDDGGPDTGRFPGSSLFPNNSSGNDDDFAVRATATITIPPGQGGPWTFATGVIGPMMTLVPTGATWRYLDDGSDQGTAWRQSGFVDTAWESGAGEFGYGEGDEATLVDFGTDANNKFATTYFRHRFNVPSTEGIATLTLRVKRDDGIAIYLNGTEIARDNLAVGAGYNAFATATATDDGQTFLVPISVPVNLLVAGDNVLAAEVHQVNGTSTDMTFEAELIAGSEVPPVPPVGNVILPAGSVWKYLDNGTNQGTAWRGAGFNDASWASGPAELGYGDGPATTISFGPDTNNKYRTTYFRKSFSVADPSLYAGMKFRVVRDDGVAIYLNGTLVVEDGLPATFDANTFADITVGGADETHLFRIRCRSGVAHCRQQPDRRRSPPGQRHQQRSQLQFGGLGYGRPSR